MGNEGYADLQLEQYIQSLIMHYNNTIFSLPSQRKEFARCAYADIQQGEAEPPANFKQRYQNCTFNLYNVKTSNLSSFTTISASERSGKSFINTKTVESKSKEELALEGGEVTAHEEGASDRGLVRGAGIERRRGRGWGGWGWQWRGWRWRRGGWRW